MKYRMPFHCDAGRLYAAVASLGMKRTRRTLGELFARGLVRPV